MEVFSVVPPQNNSVEALQALVVELNQRLESITFELAQLKRTDGFETGRDVDLEGKRLKNVGRAKASMDAPTKSELQRKSLYEKRKRIYTADSVILANKGLITPNALSKRFAPNLGQIEEKIANAGYAPDDAQYWVSTANTDLTAEVDFGALASGFVYSTVAAGVSTPSTVDFTPGEFDALVSPIGTALEINSDSAITVTQAWHRIDTFGGAAASDLETILGMTDGDVLFLRSTANTRVITIKDTDNIYTGGVDIVLDSIERFVMFIRDNAASSKVIVVDPGFGSFQPLDATLTSIAALGTAADKMLYTTGIDTWAEASLTAAGRAILDDADTTAQRVTLGLVIGTNVQAYDAELAAIAGLVSAADTIPYFTGSGTASLLTVGASTVVGKKATGNIVALSRTELTALLNAATDALQGAVELATDAETLTGTATDRALTPANLTAKLAIPGAIGGTTEATNIRTTLLSVGAPSTLTVSGGVVTATSSYHRIETQGAAATDNLDTINGGATGGQILFLRVVAGTRITTLTESGNITIGGAATTHALALDKLTMLIWDSALSKWLLAGDSIL